MDPATDSLTVALREFTRFPVASAVWLALIGMGGVTYVLTLGTSARDEARLVGLGVGTGFVLVSIGFLIALVMAWRRDVAAVALVTGDRPEVASAQTTTFVEGYVSWAAVLLAVILIVCFGVLPPVVADGAAWGWLTSVFAGVVAFSLVFVRWRGSEYVGVHPDGIRMIRSGRLETAPWSRVQYFTSGQVGVEGKPDRASVSDEVATRIKESAIAAGLATVDQRLQAGESIDLGAVTLQAAALTLEGEPVRWDEIDSVTYEHDGENGWTHVVVKRRRRPHPPKVRESGIANLGVLEEALRTYTGLRIAP